MDIARRKRNTLEVPKRYYHRCLLGCSSKSLYIVHFIYFTNKACSLTTTPFVNWASCTHTITAALPPPPTATHQHSHQITATQGTQHHLNINFATSPMFRVTYIGSCQSYARFRCRPSSRYTTAPNRTMTTVSGGFFFGFFYRFFF